MVDHSQDECHDTGSVPLEQWLDEYRRQAFWSAPAWDRARRDHYLGALAEPWQALRARAAARQEGEPLEHLQLAQDIRAGQGGVCGVLLRGDPLRAAFLEQVILTEAGNRQVLEKCFDRYWRTLFGQAMSPEDPRRDRYLQRMAAAWAHHWNTAIDKARGRYVKGASVLRRIQSGKGYVRGGSLGGDPLRDVVLAEAVQRNEPSARDAFEREYKGLALAQAIDVDSQIRQYLDDWWHVFFVALCGDAEPPGKLHQFDGKCGVKNWLALVARRFALAPRRKDSRTVPLDSHAEPLVSDGTDRVQLAHDLGKALRLLPPRQRYVVVMIYYEGQPQYQVARTLRLSTGHVGRLKKEALDHMRRFLSGNGYGPQHQ